MFGLRKKNEIVSLPCYSASAFLPAPQEGLGCQTEACVFSNAEGCRACLPCHTRVHTPACPGAQRLGSSELDRTCRAPWGCRGSPLRGGARALSTMARSFLPMREKEVGGLRMEEKGRVEGCNAWLEKFRGVQRRARWKGVAAESVKKAVSWLPWMLKEVYICPVAWLGAGWDGVGCRRQGWGCRGESDSPGSEAAGLYFLPFFPPPSAGCSEEKARQKAEPVPRRSCSDSKMALCATLIFRSWAVPESRETCQEWEWLRPWGHWPSSGVSSLLPASPESFKCHPFLLQLPAHPQRYSGALGKGGDLSWGLGV